VYSALSSEHLKEAGTADFHSILGELFVLVGAFVKMITGPIASEEKE
jgi:hypothetical protein